VLRTALVLFPGAYSGIVVPDRHYIPLAKDFSNMAEVAERLRDLAGLEAMTARAYDDLVSSGRYSLAAFVREFDDIVERRTSDRPSAPGSRRESRPHRRAAARRRANRAVNRAYQEAGQVVGLGLIAGRPTLRRLARAWAASPEARRRVSARRLVDDLLKLALIEDALDGRGDGAPIRIEPRWDDRDRRLVLGSRPAGTDGQGGQEEIAAEVVKALRAGSLQEITWNHAAVGEYVHVRLPGGNKVAVAVGFHGMNGVHSFRALVLLSSLFPELVADALEPALPAPPGAALEGADDARPA
jgi:hypothetical protein